MKEYRAGQRLKCVKEFDVLYFPDSISSLKEYTVQPNTEYMLVEIVKYFSEPDKRLYLLMPLGERGIPVELYPEKVDKYFETCK